MAVSMTYNYENAKMMLSQVIRNDARPVIILEAEKNEQDLLLSDLFFETERSFTMSFSELLSGYIYSIQKQSELLNYSYIVINRIENLHGLSATLKILSSLISTLNSKGVSIIFMGDKVCYEMLEVMHISGSKIHYIIKIEPERNTETS